MKILSIAIASLMVAASAGATSVKTDMSEDHVIELIRNNGLKTVWKTKVLRRGPDANEMLVLAFDTPKPESPIVCSTRRFEFLVSTTGKNPPTLKQERPQIALRACKGISISDFRPIYGVSGEKSALTAAQIIVDGIPAFGGKYMQGHFETPTQEAAFKKVSASDLTHIAATSEKEAEAVFLARDLRPDLLRVIATRNLDHTVSISVDLANPPDPAR